MESSANDKGKQHEKKPDADTLRALRHDIKNQLSNIFLSVEQLRYEIPDDITDCKFYLDAIAMSAEKINSLLKEEEE
jgi:nitrogen fixation/metabolism regulation signal transduction histidine kinase